MRKVGLQACRKSDDKQDGPAAVQQQLPQMTPLEQRVYAALAKVPRGRVTTYGELARAAGIRNGQRAVGRIMNKNPYPAIIPCHRVVMSTGQIGGYAYGQDAKASMLLREGVDISGDRISDMRHAMYRFDR